MQTQTQSNPKVVKGGFDQHILGDSWDSEDLKNRKPEREILDILIQYDYDFGVTLPCSKIESLIKLFEKEPRIKIVPVTREEEGVGICAGAYLAGKKPFMLIQSSGLGNSFNALASLIKTYEIPLLILASYRGYYNERMPAQIPLGSALPKMLDALEVSFLILQKEVRELEMVCKYIMNSNALCVILLSPELFENA